MTYKEAGNALYEKYCVGKCDTEVCQNCEIDFAIGALMLAEKAEKYHWHDLRKNPEDLPEEYATVEVILSTVKIVDIMVGSSLRFS